MNSLKLVEGGWLRSGAGGTIVKAPCSLLVRSRASSEAKDVGQQSQSVVKRGQVRAWQKARGAVVAMNDTP